MGNPTLTETDQYTPTSILQRHRSKMLTNNLVYVLNHTSELSPDILLN